LKCIASSTTVSSDISHSTVTITRTPGRPYGIHVSACVQARNTAASSAGQTNGVSIPHGHRASIVAACTSAATATVPCAIGPSTSVSVRTGSVNIRAGKIDGRAARSPETPKLNTAR
jgi:hypothetical protein